MTQCVIFDVDGVLVDSPHEAAWGQTLQKLMETEWREGAGETRYTPEGYTTEVYQRVVAGRPRAEGAAAMLRHFGIPDPDGARTARVCEVKQALILDLIERGEFKEFEDAVGLAQMAKAAGMKLAVASSSKNANAMLKQAHVDGGRLIDLFDANVCGRDFPKGKPHPAIFLAAAAEAGVDPKHCVVVEDAPNGAQAAKAGGMACIGIARLGDEALLEAAKADRVVDSLSKVSLDELRAMCG